MIRPRILFAAYGGGHIRSLLPVIRESQRRGAAECKILGLTTASAALAEARIPHLGIRDFLQPADAPALEEGRRLTSGLGTRLVDPEESAAYLGLNYRELVEQVGALEAASRYAHLGRAAFHPIQLAGRILDQLRPDAVVTTNSPRTEAALIEAAGVRGLPSLCISDLFATGSDFDRLRRPGFATRICVLSETVKAHLVRAGRSPEEILITGNPAFDSLYDPAVQEAGLRLRASRGWSDQRVALWIGGPDRFDPELPRRIERELQAAAARHPDWELVIRPHPNEAIDFGELPPRVHVSPRTEAAHPLLYAIDTAITVISTLGLEAALAGRPLISCEMSKMTGTLSYGALGLSRPVHRLDQIEDALEASFTQESATAGLPERSPAAGRVADAIEALVGS